MSAKRVGWLVYGVLVLAVAFALGYFAGSSGTSHEVQVTVAPRVSEEGTAQKLPAAETQTQTGLVNLNTADEAKLQTLPGIGPELASRIVAYRRDVGPFVTIEQIMDVEGIGEVRFARMEPYITVEDTP